MKRLTCLVKWTLVLAFGILPGAASAELIITEVMSSSLHPNGSANGDWWELTNTGLSNISLNGYSWDDDDGVPGQSVFPNGITIGSGESIIIVDEPDTSVAGFVQAWELGEDDYDVRVIGRTGFSPINFSGLASTGDAVWLFDNSGALVTQAVFGSVGDGGRSFAWDVSGIPLGLSVASHNGARFADEDGTPEQEDGLDVGSPGIAVQWVQTGDLVITEVMSDSAHPGGGSANGDWWELTNRGDSTIDLATYSWDDGDGIPGTTILPAADALHAIDPIEPGESIIIVDEPLNNIDVPNGFRESWGIGSNVQVVSRDDVTGVAFSGLNNTEDAVHLFNTDGELVARAAFGDSMGGGKSFEWSRAGDDLGFSVAGENGAYLALEDGLGVAPGDDVGSPAISVAGGSGPLLGDINMDGAVNGLDVEPFVTLVTGGTYQSEADMNEDGAVNGLDVAPLVAAIVGGGAAAVPEPSALALLAVGFVALWVRRRR